MVGINIDVVERLVKAVREYMVVVQGTLSDDVKQSAPWLFQQEAGNDTGTFGNAEVDVRVLVGKSRTDPGGPPHE